MSIFLFSPSRLRFLINACTLLACIPLSISSITRVLPSGIVKMAATIAMHLKVPSDNFFASNNSDELIYFSLSAKITSSSCVVMNPMSLISFSGKSLTIFKSSFFFSLSSHKWRNTAEIFSQFSFKSVSVIRT